MTEQKRKSKSGAPRTEVFAMRLDPKLKYLAEIAARKQRRSLANFIEWSIERALDSVLIVDSDGSTVSEASSRLWALEEPDRLIQLAIHYPDLMSYDEQLIWRVICEHSTYNKEANETIKFIEKDEISYELVRKCWLELKAYALGIGSEEALHKILFKHATSPFQE